MEGTGSYCLSNPSASPCGRQMGQAGGPAIFPHATSKGKKRRWPVPAPPIALFVLIKIDGLFHGELTSSCSSLVRKGVASLLTNQLLVETAQG